MKGTKNMLKYHIKKTDVLVIGGGLAGLRAADAASSKGCSVIVVSKGPRCSADVSGFNAPVDIRDSAELFLQDIQTSGCTINNYQLGKILATKATQEAHYLERMGLHFQKEPDGTYQLLQPLGCSVPRLIHTGTATGAEAERILLNTLKLRNVTVDEPITVSEILVDSGTACGAIAHKRGTQELTVYISKAVILAAGGCGGLYEVSTYPKAICGGSAALAYRAGAELTNMEFIDFEPCCLVAPQILRGRGVSSTMLFIGGTLKNNKGEDIIKKHFNDISEICKSKLSRAIWKEIQEGNGTANGGVWYDLSGIPRTELAEHEEYLPLLEQNGFDLSVDLLEVAPAAHTCLGGVRINSRCQSTIPGLFAAGEAVGNLHGANRIGGNAGAEVFVFGAIAGEEAAHFAETSASNETGAIRASENLIAKALSQMPRYGTFSSVECANKIRHIVSNGIPMLRSQSALEALPTQIKQCLDEVAFPAQTAHNFTEYLELIGMAQTASIISNASILRLESRGVFNRSDYPECDHQFDYRNTIITNNNGVLCACLSNPIQES